MIIETIEWHTSPEKPDTHTDVLVLMPDANEPVGVGFWDSEANCWRGTITEEQIYANVVAWAHLPEGPT